MCDAARGPIEPPDVAYDVDKDMGGVNLKLSKTKFNLAMAFKDHLSRECFRPLGGRPSDAMLPCATFRVFT